MEGLSGKEFVQASKQTGINFLSPLHDLRYLKKLPNDVMHVLLEGVIPHEITLFLNYALEKITFPFHS